MAGFFNALSASLVLLLIMSVGYFMGHAGWMSGTEKKFLSKYIVNIAVPCNCIVGIVNHLDRSQLADAGWMLVAGYGSILCTLLLSFGAAALLKLPRNQRGVFVAMAGLSNTLFIGIPVCTQLFGDACMPYLMTYFLANTSFMQSVGVMLVARAGSAPREKGTIPGFLKELCTKPPILGVVVGAGLMLLGIRLPTPIMSFAEYISGSVSPLALIYCGYIVYELGLRNLRLSRGLPTMLVLRLLVAPAICLGFCMLVGMEGLPLHVFLVESALPVVTQVTVLAGAYGADEQYAASGACLSIFGSFLTIPLLMTVLG